MQAHIMPLSFSLQLRSSESVFQDVRFFLRRAQERDAILLLWKQTRGQFLKLLRQRYCEGSQVGRFGGHVKRLRCFCVC